MGILLEADTESALGVQEVDWQVLPVNDKGAPEQTLQIAESSPSSRTGLGHWLEAAQKSVMLGQMLQQQRIPKAEYQPALSSQLNGEFFYE